MAAMPLIDVESSGTSVPSREDKAGAQGTTGTYFAIPVRTEAHKLQDGSPGNDNEVIPEKLLSLEFTDVRHLSQMPDFRSLCKRRMKLMWRSPKEGETEYCPCVGNRTMEAAQQHIIAWATSALKAIHACQRMRDMFEDGVDSN
ncbi:hypothetical protein FMUND_4723 [Fusarium mundagurra]|uniref:Uncharacterized protein n=1 Tax=Fusarium mundagurra TaxID=1567541 RepID=A0A8H5YXV6_9HYPO|nr:hypothetical protein FMUND_4723 [Fusarium mundagurra]